IHTISSMTVYAEARQDAAAPRKIPDIHDVRVLAFGDPIYSKAQVGQPSSVRPIPVGGEPTSRGRLGGSLASLPKTREEVESIVRLFGTSARARLGAEATETAARREAR